MIGVVRAAVRGEPGGAVPMAVRGAVRCRVPCVRLVAQAVACQTECHRLRHRFAAVARWFYFTFFLAIPCAGMTMERAAVAVPLHSPQSAHVVRFPPSSDAGQRVSPKAVPCVVLIAAVVPFTPSASGATRKVRHPMCCASACSSRVSTDAIRRPSRMDPNAKERHWCV